MLFSRFLFFTKVFVISILITIVLQNSFGGITLEKRLFTNLKTATLFQPVHLVVEASVLLIEELFKSLSSVVKKQVKEVKPIKKAHKQTKKLEKQLNKKVKNLKRNLHKRSSSKK